MSDARMVDDELLRRLDCAWSAQCGPCLNVVNAEVPKLLDENAALTAQLAAALARAEADRAALRDAAFRLKQIQRIVAGDSRSPCGTIAEVVRAALVFIRAALAAAAPATASTCHCRRPVVVPRDMCAACIEFDTDIKCYVGTARQEGGDE